MQISQKKYINLHDFICVCSHCTCEDPYGSTKEAFLYLPSNYSKKVNESEQNILSFYYVDER